MHRRVIFAVQVWIYSWRSSCCCCCWLTLLLPPRHQYRSSVTLAFLAARRHAIKTIYIAGGVNWVQRRCWGPSILFFFSVSFFCPCTCPHRGTSPPNALLSLTFSRFSFPFLLFYTANLLWSKVLIIACFPLSLPIFSLISPKLNAVFVTCSMYFII